MVLSTTKRTSSVASIVNQNSGGGSKKAGLPYQIGRESSVSIAFHKTSQYLFVLRGKRYQLQQLLAYAIINLAKLTEIKTAADALVTSKIAAADALPNVTVTSSNTVTEITTMITNLDVTTKENTYNDAVTTDAAGSTADTIAAKNTAETAYTSAKTAETALNLLIAAITAAATAQTNVTAATGIKMSREADLTAYTAPA